MNFVRGCCVIQAVQTVWTLYRFLLDDDDDAILIFQQMRAAFGEITSWFCLSDLVAILSGVCTQGQLTLISDPLDLLTRTEESHGLISLQRSK